MKEMEYLKELTGRYPVLEAVKENILAAYKILRDCYEGGNKALIAGNGGSCADSEHIVGELMKGFVKRRPVPEAFARALKEVDGERGEALAASLQRGLPAIALTGHSALTTAFLNDVNGEMSVAQQLYGVTVAKAAGIKTIGLTGKDGGAIGKACDVAIVVPERETYKIQELHLPVYHTLCLMLEEHFYEV